MSKSQTAEAIQFPMTTVTIKAEDGLPKDIELPVFSDDLQEAIVAAVNEYAELISKRDAINDKLKAIRSRLKTHAITPESFKDIIKTSNLSPEKQIKYHHSYKILCQALNIPHTIEDVQQLAKQ